MRTVYYNNKHDLDDGIELAEFFYTRLHYKSDEQIVRIYNREYDIIPEYNKVQFYLFIMLDWIFNARFEKSPMVIDKENMKIELLGKVLLKKPRSISIINESLKKV